MLVSRPYLWCSLRYQMCSSCRTCIFALSLCASLCLAKTLTRFCLAPASSWWQSARNFPCWLCEVRRSVSRWTFRASCALCVTDWTMKSPSACESSTDACTICNRKKLQRWRRACENLCLHRIVSKPELCLQRPYRIHCWSHNRC